MGGQTSTFTLCCGETALMSEMDSNHQIQTLDSQINDSVKYREMKPYTHPAAWKKFIKMNKSKPAPGHWAVRDKELSRYDVCKELPSGELYLGEWYDNKPDGYGAMTIKPEQSLHLGYFEAG